MKSSNPFDLLPTNETRSFVMVSTYNGCQVYIPTKVNDVTTMENIKNIFQRYLNGLAPKDVPPDTA